MARHNPGLGPLAPVIAALLRSGALERDEAEGETYLWPAPDLRPAPDFLQAAEAGARPGPAPGRVRLLAPFDPLVWDRRRFEHLWGWPYRFEACTPPAQRRLGCCALPVLWGDAVIGWANVSVAGGQVRASLGYAGRVPTSLAFRRVLDAELARLGRFLTPRTPARPAPAAGGTP